MARGTNAGLLESEHAQSVHKLAILEQYAPPFVAKTGMHTGRVVLVDGYAGTGRMGTAPGSAALLAGAASRLRSHSATTVYLCERSRKNYQQLKAVEAAFLAKGVDVHARNEDVARAAGSILEGARHASLLWFLDPCGALLPFEQLVTLLTDRSRLEKGRRLPTEALLNFSAGFTRRVGGAWLASSDDAHGIARLTEVCGGDWWKEKVWSLGPFAGAADYRNVVEAVAHEYAARLAARTHTHPVVVPVREDVDHQPIYHLIFLSGSPHGVATFLDAAGSAWPQWLAATAEPDAAFELPLWGDTLDGSVTARDSRRQAAIRRQEELTATVQGNIELIAAAHHRPFQLLPHVEDVYCGVEGIATLTQVRAALRGLVRSGALEEVAKHKDPLRRLYARAGVQNG